MKQCYVLLFTLCFFNLSIGQNTLFYTVESIPYQSFQGDAEVTFNQDDVYSDVINIPFDFSFSSYYQGFFYEDFFSQLVISSNGSISFDTSLANGYCPWAFSDTLPVSDSNHNLAQMNIFGPFHDIYNMAPGVDNGVVFTGVSGEAPHRKFYVVYDSIPQYSCTELLSSSHIVLHETTGIIEVFIYDKPLCDWNSGNAVIGLQKSIGGDIVAITPPGRNTGAWETSSEAWRFTPASNFDVVICDVDNNGVEQFDLDPYKANILELFNLSPDENSITILNENDVVVSGSVALTTTPIDYTIVINPGITEETFQLTLSAIDCTADADTDGMPSDMEDVNNDGNLANDDTDGDGIPNYLDDDDDGDNVLTNIELVFGDGRTTENSTSSPTFLDTDSDGIPNHLDFDDDGDGILSIDEDYNENGDPTDDDLNNNGVPDYLDAQQLNVEELSLETNLFTLYPNPTSTDINIAFPEQLQVESKLLEIAIYDLQGREVMQSQQRISNNNVALNISNLASGNYILMVKIDGLQKAKKFIVE
ncbi:T9SS type A sorting domain-containing protein [Mangrovimonas spongiae]|uniref:T9SS C-terminal target domain-containing protein n=1 Tax=Mangrovimonas spongiae TaxID=2494697 RepID=A0A428K781_9FLAO|nr:T9SS type A sorting domain-containing protein [Mangrovimonas spongiae]RSK42120.1 T9SS C-terminal target domain-containing protein [Mangrovimonas spongiae]